MLSHCTVRNNQKNNTKTCPLTVSFDEKKTIWLCIMTQYNKKAVKASVIKIKHFKTMNKGFHNILPLAKTKNFPLY